MGDPWICREFQLRSALPLKANVLPIREGNASVLVRFRLHFLLLALWTPSPGLEE